MFRSDPEERQIIQRLGQIVNSQTQSNHLDSISLQRVASSIATVKCWIVKGIKPGTTAEDMDVSDMVGWRLETFIGGNWKLFVDSEAKNAETDSSSSADADQEHDRGGSGDGAKQLQTQHQRSSSSSSSSACYIIGVVVVALLSVGVIWATGHWNTMTGWHFPVV